MNEVTTLTITNDDDRDFEFAGAKFRIYREILWADGGEFDDMVIAQFPMDSEITITESMVAEAKNYQEYLAEEIED